MRSCLAALAMLLLAPRGSTAGVVARPGPALPPSPQPASTAAPSLTEAGVREFLRDWPVWERAMGGLGRRPLPPALTGPDRLAAADGAADENDAIRETLARSGVTRERFIELYHAVAMAWYAVQESRERDETDHALDEQIAALAKSTASGSPGRATADRMRAMRAAQERDEQRFPPPPGAIAAVRSHRAELAAIFGEAR